MHKKKSGFSLAEMLVVVLVTSCIAVAASSFVIKKNKTLTLRPERGKYECYYKNGVLRQIYSINGKVTQEKSVGATCDFNPTLAANADFIAFTAIGGGGGGAFVPVPNTYDDPRSSSSASSGVAAYLNSPDWIREEQAKGVKVKSWTQNLKYTRLMEGRGGGSGEVQTLYLVRPGFKRCSATVGSGGAAGTSTSVGADPGAPTTVSCDGSIVLRAVGGTGGNEYSVSALLMDGMALSEFEEPKGSGNYIHPTKPGGTGEASGYMIDVDSARKNQSATDFVTDYGYGGKGGGGTIKTRSAAQTRSYVTEANNTVSKNIAIQSGKNNGANTSTPPQPGKPGAFVATW